VPRSCSFSRPGLTGKAEWLLDETTLRLTPEGRAAEVYPICELTSVTGDGYEITAGPITLSRLGAEGPTLLQALRDRWLTQRAAALRLTGSGEAHPFTGMLGGTPFHSLLHEDVLLLAPDGSDIAPIFLALVSAATFDESAYAVHLTLWTGAELVLTKLAGQTEEFLQRIQTGRVLLASESAATLAASVPGLAASSRALLSGAWPPGRPLPLNELETVSPGFLREFTSTWLPNLPRRREAGHLLELCGNGATHLGFSRPFWQEKAGGSEADAAGAVESAAGPPATAGAEGAPAPAESSGGTAGPEADAAPSPAAPGPVLWMLAADGDRWFIEALSLGDHATYRFQAGPEMPALAAALFCAPQFSKEALYLPPPELTGERAPLAIAARDLAFLRALRDRFRGRVIHRGFESWSTALRADAPTQ
jgi:hypothetical protein